MPLNPDTKVAWSRPAAPTPNHGTIEAFAATDVHSAIAVNEYIEHYPRAIMANKCVPYVSVMSIAS